jgi:Peptidase family M28
VRRLAPLALLVALLFPPGAGATEQVDGLRAVVVAHLDGVPEGPATNDDGSGVAAMLEVARGLRGKPVLVATLGAVGSP